MSASKHVMAVTGGAQGIGKGIVRHMLEHGWCVAMLDTDREAGQETLTEYRPLGNLLFVQADVAVESDVSTAITETVAKFGRLDALVNNAGIASPGGGPVEQLTLAAWQRVLDVNLTGMFLCAKHAVPYLRKTQGAIVNIASTRALMSEPGSEAYAASKGGVVALTHALALSLGPEIRVNCISPGWIEVGAWRKKAQRQEPQHSEADHRQHPCGRVGTPADIAATVAHLVGDSGGFITGQNLVIDGGMTKKMIYV